MVGKRFPAYKAMTIHFSMEGWSGRWYGGLSVSAPHGVRGAIDPLHRELTETLCDVTYVTASRCSDAYRGR